MGVGCWGQGQERQGRFTLTKGDIIMIDSMPRVGEAGVVWMSAWEGKAVAGAACSFAIASRYRHRADASIESAICSDLQLTA